jgi:hypothetical protein
MGKFSDLAIDKEQNVLVKSNTKRVRKYIHKLTDEKLGDAMHDARKLAAQMMDDTFKNDSGLLKSSLRVRKKFNKENQASWALETTAVNTRGTGYGAKQEWGYHDRSGKPVKGKFIIQKASWGMIRRHEKGKKWEENVPSDLKAKK